jgi:hypothetical protein
MLKYCNGLSVLGNCLRSCLVPNKFTPAITNPRKNNHKNIFLHILIKFKNITASNPIFSINNSSGDDITGLIHENNP